MPAVTTDPEPTDTPADWRQLRKLVQREVGCESTAADAVQEAYLRWFAKPDRAAVGNPGGYLYQAALNIARNLRLRSGREESALRSLTESPAAPTHEERCPERICADRQKLGRVMQAIDALPARCREVFVLYRFHDLDQGEIASRLGISRNMVERHMMRAMRDCRAALHDER